MTTLQMRDHFSKNPQLLNHNTHLELPCPLFFIKLKNLVLFQLNAAKTVKITTEANNDIILLMLKIIKK